MLVRLVYGMLTPRYDFGRLYRGAALSHDLHAQIPHRRTNSD
jgi:hypothetical protein